MTLYDAADFSHEASFQKKGGQPGRMDMAVTLKYKEGAYLTHRGRKEFGGSDKKCFDHHAFYVDYNITNVFYSAIKVA